MSWAHMGRPPVFCVFLLRIQHELKGRLPINPIRADLFKRSFVWDRGPDGYIIAMPSVFFYVLWRLFLGLFWDCSYNNIYFSTTIPLATIRVTVTIDWLSLNHNRKFVCPQRQLKKWNFNKVFSVCRHCVLYGWHRLYPNIRTPLI